MAGDTDNENTGVSAAFKGSDPNTNDENSSGNSQQEMPKEQGKTTVVAAGSKATKIFVDITSPVPIVVFYGPPTIGKTVAMIRLSRFLKNNKLIAEPDKQFRKNDSEYKTLCDKFDDEFIYKSFAPSSTNVINFLLIRVKKNEKDICQLLEAPGEHYFDVVSPNAHYLPYFDEIVRRPNSKIYVFFLELDWQNSETREKYENRILDFRGRITRNDSVILLVNKADERPRLLYNGRPSYGEFKKLFKHQYPEIYKEFMSNSLFSFFKARRYRCNFIVFSAGSFTPTDDPRETAFTNSDDHYPEKLWSIIYSRLKGKFFG